VLERRERILSALLELLTAPDSPISREDLAHFRYVNLTFGSAQAVDVILQKYVHYPDTQIEIAVSIVAHVLERITGFLGFSLWSGRVFSRMYS
jgi:hypothetical protein